MVGGADEDVAHAQPIFDALKPEGENGFAHAGRSAPATSRRWSTTASSTRSCRPTPRAGSCSRQVDLVDDVPAVLRSWRTGTVIRSWLLDLLVDALEEDPGLSKIRGYADDSGEGRWTVQAAIDHAVPMPAIAASLFARFASRQDDSPTMKAVAAMRHQFGGHAVQQAAAAGVPQPEQAHDLPAVPRPDLPAVPAVAARANGGRRRVRSSPWVPMELRDLELVDFRSYEQVAVEPRARRLGVRRAERPGQDEPGRGGRLRREPRQPPGRQRLRHWSGPARSARWSGPTCSRDDRDTLVELEITPGRSNRARLNRSPLPAGARRARRADRRRVRAGGPRAGEGRPGRAAAVPRRAAGRSGAADGRRAPGLRARAQATQRPAEVRRRRHPVARRARRGAADARRVGRAPGRRRQRPPGRPPRPGGRARPAGREGVRRARPGLRSGDAGLPLVGRRPTRLGA